MQIKLKRKEKKHQQQKIYSKSPSARIVSLALLFAKRWQEISIIPLMHISHSYLLCVWL